MRRLPPATLLVVPLLLAGCNGAGTGAGGNAAMHDMAVVEGTANDSMVDLDDAVTSGTAIAENSGVAVRPRDEAGEPSLALPLDNAGESENINEAVAPE